MHSCTIYFQSSESAEEYKIKFFGSKAMLGQPYSLRERIMAIL